VGRSRGATRGAGTQRMANGLKMAGSGRGARGVDALHPSRSPLPLPPSPQGAPRPLAPRLAAALLLLLLLLLLLSYSCAHSGAPDSSSHKRPWKAQTQARCRGCASFFSITTTQQAGFRG
jgi:hypothetical protein